MLNLTAINNIDLTKESVDTKGPYDHIPEASQATIDTLVKLGILVKRSDGYHVINA